MRSLPTVLLAASLLLGPAAGVASAVSVDDLLALKANGLGDDILVALIETDGSSFTLQAADLIALRKAGLSERVLLAMLRTRNAPAEAAGTALDSRESVEQAPIPVEQTVTQTVAVPVHSTDTVYVPVEVPVAVPVAAPIARRHDTEMAKPVYWGFGGQLRPDAWSAKGAAATRSREDAHEKNAPKADASKQDAAKRSGAARSAGTSAEKTPGDKTPAATKPADTARGRR
jgi:hypothetical protein